MKSKISIFWLRRDLRLEDNAGLSQALASGFPVLPIFIFDTVILKTLEDKNDRRVDLYPSIAFGNQPGIERTSLKVKYFLWKSFRCF